MTRFYSVAVLESPDQDSKLFYGEITMGQKLLVCEFNITNTESSINSSVSVDINRLCSLINNDHVIVDTQVVVNANAEQHEPHV
jgi:hypothetical protein